MFEYCLVVPSMISDGRHGVVVGYLKLPKLTTASPTGAALGPGLVYVMHCLQS